MKEIESYKEKALSAEKRCLFFENDIDGLDSKIRDFEIKIADLNTNELKLKEVINDMQKYYANQDQQNFNNKFNSSDGNRWTSKDGLQWENIRLR